MNRAVGGWPETLTAFTVSKYLLHWITGRLPFSVNAMPSKSSLALSVQTHHDGITIYLVDSPV